MLLPALAAVVGAGLYFRRLLLRALSLRKTPLSRTGRVLAAAAGALIGILCLDFFSSVGLVLLHLLVFALLTEPLHLLLRRRGGARWDRLFRSGLLPVAATALVLALGYFNMYHVVRTVYTVETDKALTEPYRILMISDTHYGSITKEDGLGALCARLEAEDADLLVLVGDLVDERTTAAEMEQLFSQLGAVHTRDGVYFVYGNHDEQKYDASPAYTPAELRAALADSGIVPLEDQTVSPAAGLTLAGRADVSPGRAAVDALLNGADRQDFVVLLDHQPVDYAAAAAAGTDLLLSGHTHAGQIFPAGYFSELLSSSELYYGRRQVGGMCAVVSAGAAGWGYPIRTQGHSEYVVLDIVPNA